MTTTLTATLCTPAWLLKGMTGSAPGLLEIENGEIVFTGEDGRVFGAPIDEVATIFPWYYFGGGAKFTVGRNTYRVSFVRPNGGLLDIFRGRRAGRDCRRAIGAG
jgi:hypothetical protein